MKNTSPPQLFDPEMRRAKLARAAKRAADGDDFLARIAAETMGDRLNAITRNFDETLDYQSLFDCMSDQLGRLENVRAVSRHGGLSHANNSLLDSCPNPLDAEDGNQVQLVTSVFGLHWENDLPGTFLRIRRHLKPDGLFMAALPGDRTLHELRTSLIEAETEIAGSVSLRVDPFGEVKQYGSLLQRAGFTLPVVDTDMINVRYSSLAKLVADLRNWGGTRSMPLANGHAGRRFFERVEGIYREKFADPDGKIRASFEIVYLTGWSPHESQQKALKPGSGKINLSDVLGGKDS